MTPPHPWRDWGLGDSMKYITGIPRVVGVAEGMPPCPNCHCDTLYVITVAVCHPSLHGDGHGRGTYVGCPACPFASPMLMTSTHV